jgi:hypothetical protein
MLVVWYNSRNGREIILARQRDVLLNRTLNVECSDDYKSELDKFLGCVPEKCGRVVSDKLVSASEADILLRFAKSILKLAHVDGGIKLLELQSGALSKTQTEFIKDYTLDALKKFFNGADFAIYK